jgi:6-pyruvoyltetrahydropterin/6-carboxytetrahydropterin synthase
MLELTRSVRFCVNDSPGGGAAWGAPDNTFAAYPSMRGMGRYYEIDVRCRGTPSEATGYFLNIKQIDQAVRSAAIPVIERACRERPAADPSLVLAEIVGPVNAALDGHVSCVRWKLTPYYSIEMSPTPISPTTLKPGGEPRVLMRQQFEFAASHRLHSAGLSDAENRAMFGKCNNPSGHGHNYRVEACVESPVTREGARFSLADLERAAAATIVERFDHKHLNVDTPEFDVHRGGVNPSVENIARVCFELLAPTVTKACPEAKLRSVTVWETDKTWCTYPAGEDK